MASFDGKLIYFSVLYSAPDIAADHVRSMRHSCAAELLLKQMYNNVTNFDSPRDAHDDLSLYAGRPPAQRFFRLQTLSNPD